MKCKVHKYKRVITDRNKYPVYNCIRCPHYITEPFVIGREAECWYCGNTFIMNPKSLLLKPHCGCKTSISLEKVSKGAAIEGKNLLSEIRVSPTKKIDPEAESMRDSVIDSLMAKFNR